MASEGPPEAKKQKIDPPTDSSELSDCEITTDKETQKALEAIDNIQNELDNLNDQASEEIVEVEKKYRKLKKPFLDQRNEIIEQIPNFWVATLLNHPQIAVVVNQKEKECLQYLNKVEVEEFEGIKLGYKLNFSFKPNPYFTNEVLCKEFHLLPVAMGDPKSKSTAINWKDGMNLIQRTKSDRLSVGANKRRLTQQRSFFAWFLDNRDPSGDSIATVIKDDMWPNPLQYYLVSEVSDSDLEENGMGESDDELDESVVVVEDDDDEEEEEVYEVEDDDDDDLDTTGDVEVIEEEEVGAEVLDDDDDDDDKHVEEIDDSKDLEDDEIDDDKHVEEVDSKDEDAGDDKKTDSGDKADEDNVSKGGDASKEDKTEAV